ncbi:MULTISPECIES: NAD(P)/FAD-dependent oxidoreductase [unclassified Methylophaga]|jgi:predicted Rossmann fold flavoprotein|uniref:NAD(P)/FAD-dependent oxidoreductase n=2 Tax=Methylophaga TaxID=40222 RepID=UPI000C913062|nr:MULTISPECIES: NAD(P)/FAD-dependent oxidoreductase [unclassified Methylophaga]MAY18477.1 aminoacetone oxidase family FAD-binding enzyme [Methylophaga sp.]MBN45894.1 aminoacetone oxidase family FAD-binding enzyme [Methylophaga sp.]HCD04974.1 aminoacetone oxidase family FAD-binding enzyme [Methylophaga sp.]|tara:strand:- start:11327 stop:12523 length:1197 start_codon:yes stop_codon:yes gene_type:complete
MTINNELSNQYDVIIIGAGAAGLMCAIAAGQRGRRVLVLEHANKVGKKILMSGGGRCNFTNMYCSPENFISNNPHFVKSALSRYTPWHFIEMVERHQIAYHEKKLGQLFCDESSKDIVQMLVTECEWAGVTIKTNTPVKVLETAGQKLVETSEGKLQCASLVIATGGLSIPKMGATGFGFELARRLNIPLLPTRAGLVPVVLDDHKLKPLAELSGISLDSITETDTCSFRENILFTHRGLSGPAILQASSYWQPGEVLKIDMFPGIELTAYLMEMRREKSKTALKTILAEKLTRRVAQLWCEQWIEDKPVGQLSDADIEQIVAHCQPWTVKPSGTEGYRTAEVTLGGIDTNALSSKTMESKEHPGLYFIGEVVDVTGHLGGHNFQWAWASGHAAGQFV